MRSEWRDRQTGGLHNAGAVDDSAAAPVRPALSERQITRGLRVSIAEGAFATLYMTLVGGMFVNGLALAVGAGHFEIALLTAIPALATGFGFVSGYLVRTIGSRRRLVLWTAGVGRSVFVLLVPFLLTQTGFGAETLLWVVAVSSVLMTIAGTTWTSWMSDLVPEDRRGRFFGLRNAILGIVGVTAAYSAGRALDWFKLQDKELLAFGLAFALAVVFGGISTLLLSRQPEPPLPARPMASLRELLFGPLSEPQFRRLMKFAAVWYLTGTLGSPFYIAHLITNLKFSYAAIGVYSMIGGITGLVFHLFWGRVIDRFGARPVTIINFALVGVMPLLWVFATPEFRLPIWIDAVMNGVVWSGASLGLWNLLLELADNPRRKESYFALHSVVTGLGAFAASLIAGAGAQALNGLELRIGTSTFVNYHLMFLLAGIARFAALPLLVRVQERGATGVRHTMRVLTSYAIWRLNSGKTFVLDALGLRPRDAD